MFLVLFTGVLLFKRTLSASARAGWFFEPAVKCYDEIHGCYTYNYRNDEKFHMCLLSVSYKPAGLIDCYCKHEGQYGVEQK
jgi:hypothetical protein